MRRAIPRRALLLFCVLVPLVPLAGCGGQAQWPGGLAPVSWVGPVRVVLVRPRGSARLLESLLRRAPGIELSTMTQQEYDDEPRPPEVAVYSGCSPGKPLIGRVVIFGRTPAVLGWKAAGRLGGEERLVAEESHPIFRLTAARPRTARVRGAIRMRPPTDARVILRSDSGSVVAASLERINVRLVAFGFTETQVDFPDEDGFRLLLARAVELVAGRLLAPGLEHRRAEEYGH